MQYNRAAIYDEAEEFVRRVKYKPGSSFEVDCEPVGLLFTCSFKTLDATGPTHKPVGISGKRLLSWGKLDGPKKTRIKRYIEAIHGLLMDGETHELDEWLEIDGVRIFNPHEKPTRLDVLKEVLLEKLNVALGGDLGSVAV